MNWMGLTWRNCLGSTARSRSFRTSRRRVGFIAMSRRWSRPPRAPRNSAPRTMCGRRTGRRTKGTCRRATMDPTKPCPSEAENDLARGTGIREAFLARQNPPRTTANAGRFYTIAEGVQLPSVTTILNVVGKPALVQWAAKEERTMVSAVAADLAKTPPMSRTAYLTTLTDRLGKQRANQKLLAKASEIGSQVHAMAEWNFRRALGQKVGPEPKIEDRAQWGYMALEDWASSVKFKPLKIEQTVWSTTHGYAGTMDLLALVNDVPTLVDFKTGKAIYGEAHLQNVAYQVAYNEMGHEPQAQAGLIVRLPKVETDPAFETAVVPPVAELFPVFQAAHRLWVWWYAGEQAYHARRQKPAPVVQDKAAGQATEAPPAEQPTAAG